MGGGSGQISPLVLDLTGNGIALTALAPDSPYFDLTGSGFARKTGWVGAGTGLLCLDRNGNGNIDDITELFGSNDAANGFAALAALDANGDGVIDASDAQFANLRVWVDNGDGLTQGGELLSLADLGITSISLSFTASNQAVDGNTLRQVGSYTLADGTARTMADAWFANSATYTRPDVTVTPSGTVAALPQLTGSGRMVDLRSAMMADATLQAEVQALVLAEQSDTGNLSAAVETLLLEWSGSSAINPDSRGGLFDARKLDFLEKYSGLDFANPDYAVGWGASDPADPRWRAAVSLREGWNETLDAALARLVLQSSNVVPEFQYSAAFDFVLPSLDFGTSLTSLFGRLGELSGQNAGQWETALRIADAFRLDARLPSAPFLARIAASASASVAAMASAIVYGIDFSIGADGNLSLTGPADHAIIVTGPNAHIFDIAAPQSTLAPPLDDRIVYTEGSGAVDVNLADYSDSPDNVLAFTQGISASDIRISADATFNLTVTVGNGDDRITFDRMLEKRAYGVQSIQFADGTIWSHDQIVAQELLGTAGDDILVGDDIANTLGGGTGNDTLIGNGGADTYVYAAQGGNDVIRSHDNLATLVMQDIASTGVALSRPGAGNDLVLTIVATGKTVTLSEQFKSYFNWGVGSVAFANGETWSGAQIRQMLLDQESAATGGSVWGYGDSADTIVAGTGDKYLCGKGGGDTYIYTSAGGNDVIDDGNISATLVMQGIHVADIVFGRSGNDLELLVMTTGKVVTVKGEFSVSGLGAMQSIVFADGSSWTPAQILATTPAVIGIGDGTFFGTSADDVLIAGVGTETLEGGAGNDTYIFTRGSGSTSIIETGGSNTLKLSTGMTSANVTFAKSGNDLLISDGTAGDLITLHNQFL
ncbi:MAG: hypothetical protein HY055_16785, partial [Magnetospirillum sp.]|nr:hypothetical protein [Magnetospirillum sp.]